MEPADLEMAALALSAAMFLSSFQWAEENADGPHEAVAQDQTLRAVLELGEKLQPVLVRLARRSESQ